MEPNARPRVYTRFPLSVCNQRTRWNEYQVGDTFTLTNEIDQSTTTYRVFEITSTALCCEIIEEPVNSGGAE